MNCFRVSRNLLRVEIKISMKFSPFIQEIEKVVPDWDDSNVNDPEYIYEVEVSGRGLYKIPGFYIRAKVESQNIEGIRLAEIEWKKLSQFGVKIPDFQIVIGNRQSQDDEWVYIVVKSIEGIVLPDFYSENLDLDSLVECKSFTTLLAIAQYYVSKYNSNEIILLDLYTEQFRLDSSGDIYLVDLDQLLSEYDENEIWDRLNGIVETILEYVENHNNISEPSITQMKQISNLIDTHVTTFEGPVYGWFQPLLENCEKLRSLLKNFQ